MFFANPVYRVRSHPKAWHLKTFQWHGWTWFSNNSIFLSKIYQFFVGKYSTFIYNPQALLESEKILTLSVSLAMCTECEEILNRDTKKIFTGHGLRITKCPAVWYFSIFLFEKYQFLLEIFYLYLESSSASRKWKKFNVVLAQNNKPSTKRDFF